MSDDQKPEDLLPPHDIEAEQGAIGSILLDPQHGAQTSMEILSEPRSTFYDLRHQALFDVIVDMVDQGEFVDLITLHSKLKDKSQLEAIGGMPYIAQLTTLTPCGLNARYYLEIIEEKAYCRRVQAACAQLSIDIQNSRSQAEELAAEVETRILSLRRIKKTGTRVESINRVFDRLEDSYEGKTVAGLLNTGYYRMDGIFKGMWPGDLIVLAGRPGLGKSTLAMNICENLAIDQPTPDPVTYFSFEMDEDKLNRRSLASISRVDLDRFEKTKGDTYANDSDFKKIMVARSRLNKAPIQIEFCPGWSIMQIRARARRSVTQHGSKLIVVDMLQLVGSDRGARGNRATEVGDVSRGLKALAGELQIPIIAISSMNREIDKSEGRRPQMSDLRESGDIESDADVVAMLYCEKPDAEEDGVLPMKLCIRKNRNGGTGEIDLIFRKRLSRFDNAATTRDVPTGGEI